MAWPPTDNLCLGCFSQQVTVLQMQVVLTAFIFASGRHDSIAHPHASSSRAADLGPPPSAEVISVQRVHGSQQGPPRATAAGAGEEAAASIRTAQTTPAAGHTS